MLLASTDMPINVRKCFILIQFICIALLSYFAVKIYLGKIYAFNIRTLHRMCINLVFSFGLTIVLAMIGSHSSHTFIAAKREREKKRKAHWKSHRKYFSNGFGVPLGYTFNFTFALAHSPISMALTGGQSGTNEKFELSFKPFKLKWKEWRRYPLIPIGMKITMENVRREREREEVSRNDRIENGRSCGAVVSSVPNRVVSPSADPHRTITPGEEIKYILLESFLMEHTCAHSLTLTQRTFLFATFSAADETIFSLLTYK